MNAYLWYVDENLGHHMRAASIDEVRERISLTHGDQIARQAVIKLLRASQTPGLERTAAA
ncbi:MAG TPA: hypothetical protein VGR87_12920 [Candidatus Limnocylindria bacterium]|jgi:hypothetical protein|nr:hypothetical protein [Candidatus Limnocylindria bacterium]